MTNEEFNTLFRARTLRFALNIIAFLEIVPFNSVTKTLSGQFCNAATSVGSNWRAFCRGRSINEKYSKICIVVEEGDECQYWLEIFNHLCYGNKHLLPPLIAECDEIVKVTTTIKHELNKNK
ncbi:MAG TPA: four helix bundle protein [Saprospiraceae bacterium]|nr:four helix bundle protein [Saprospiraceae bacterium]